MVYKISFAQCCVLACIPSEVTDGLQLKQKIAWTLMEGKAKKTSQPVELILVITGGKKVSAQDASD